MPSDLPPSPQSRTELIINFTRKLFNTSLAGVALVAVAIPLILSLGGVDEAAAVTLHAGDILVANGAGGVIKIDPETGAQTVITTGSFIANTTGIAIEANGQILVALPALAGTFVPGIIRVDPATGTQSLVTQGGYLNNPLGIAIESDGQILVTDSNVQVPDTPMPGVVRVDPTTGTQAVVTTGPNLTSFGIAVVGKPKKK